MGADANHVELGYHIVSLLPDLAIASALVRCHEERHDGTGYPRACAARRFPSALACSPSSTPWMQ